MSYVSIMMMNKLMQKLTHPLDLIRTLVLVSTIHAGDHTSSRSVSAQIPPPTLITTDAESIVSVLENILQKKAFWMHYCGGLLLAKYDCPLLTIITN